MSTAEGLAESAKVEKPAICSMDASNIMDRSTSRQELATRSLTEGGWTVAETVGKSLT